MTQLTTARQKGKQNLEAGKRLAVFGAIEFCVLLLLKKKKSLLGHLLTF